MNDSRSILYSAGRNDECLTPSYAVDPILKYIPDNAVVWCPFDKIDSAFVQVIGAHRQVLASHIDNGHDFYNWEPSRAWDVIVSNPPFTNKRGIFERALSFGKPFALLMTNTWLNDSAPKQLFRERELQLLMFERRVHFLNNGQVNKKTTFSSSYYCCDFLPKQIIMKDFER